MSAAARTAQAGVDVGALDDFAVGEFRLVAVGDHEVGVTRLADGDLVAVLNVCPHKKGPVCLGRFGGSWLPGTAESLSYDMEGRVLQCPWHGWEFDIHTGETLFGVSRMRLRTFDAWADDGRVLVAHTPRRHPPPVPDRTR